MSDQPDDTQAVSEPTSEPEEQIDSVENFKLEPEPEPAPPTETHLRLAEALVFACAAPVPLRALAQVLPVEADPEAVVAALKKRYAGRGVELIETAGGVMFRTALDVAPHLVKVIEVPRRLPRAAMEALAIIAYHQPVTRAEIEEIRGAALAQTSLELLLENGLVTSKGRKETPGRPTMWGTTPGFLAQFGLKELTDLPKRDELLVEPPSLLSTPEAEEPVATEDAPATEDPVPEDLSDTDADEETSDEAPVGEDTPA